MTDDSFSPLLALHEEMSEGFFSSTGTNNRLTLFTSAAAEGLLKRKDFDIHRPCEEVAANIADLAVAINDAVERRMYAKEKKGNRKLR